MHTFLHPRGDGKEDGSRQGSGPIWHGAAFPFRFSVLLTGHYLLLQSTNRKVLAMDEARRVATNIAKLPTLLIAKRN